MTEPIINSEHAIIHETDEYLIVSKSGNCPVHEGGLYKSNCMTKILENELGYRVFPVYRLDRETSGLIVFAKKNEFVKKIFDSITYKEYIGICEGEIEKPLLIDKPIGECEGENIKWKKCISDDGKPSKTFIEPLMYYDKRKITILKIIPMSGRQHQIRVHLSSIGHPIIGDKVYGKSDKLFKDYIDGKEVPGRQLLHLAKIIVSEEEITTELPEDMIVT